MTRPHMPRAFALVDAVASIVVLFMLIAAVLVASHRSRGLAWQAGSVANLHEFAAVTSSYAADNADTFWSYTWRANEICPSQYPEFRGPFPDTLSATGAQAMDIFRRRALPGFSRPPAWIPSAGVPHWALADYLDQPLHLRFAVSPGDRYHIKWSNDVEGFLRDYVIGNQEQPLGISSAYWTSYRMGPAFYSPDYVTATHGTVLQGPRHSTYTITDPNVPIGGRRVAEVAFPSQKVFLSDTAQWQGVKSPIWWAGADARVPILFVDGSAHVRATGQANPGFNPGNPYGPFPQAISYEPSQWEPARTPSTSIYLKGSYYWTRHGLGGRDFDGREVAVPGPP